jgi:hypothetical protein
MCLFVLNFNIRIEIVQSVIFRIIYQLPLVIFEHDILHNIQLPYSFEELSDINLLVKLVLGLLE